MISRHHGTVIDFDFQKVLELSHDNPVFYVQYAHARICSVFRNAAKLFGNLTEEFVVAAGGRGTMAEEEISIIKCLASWPQVVEHAALCQEPHRITNFLCKLSGEFHSLWNLGKESAHRRFIIQDDEEATCQNLFFIKGIATVLRDGLNLLGIVPVSDMR
jgi:arginyl-tRNA synthetase